MPSIIQCIYWAIEDLRCHVNSLFAKLSEHIECQSMMVWNGIVLAINSLLDIEKHDKIWQDYSCTLANLCANKANQYIIHSSQFSSNPKSKVCEDMLLLCSNSCLWAPKYKSHSLKELTNHICSLLNFLPAICMIFNKLPMLHLLPCHSMKLGDCRCYRKVSSVHTSRHGHSMGCRILYCKLCFVTGNFYQYVVMEGRLETINVTASTKQKCQSFFVMQSKWLCSLLTPWLRILWFSLEISKVLKKLVKSLDSATQGFASLALSNLCSGTREQKELVVKQGILCVLLFLLNFSDLEVEPCTLYSIAPLQLNAQIAAVSILQFT